MSLQSVLREHWPEYLIEAWALGCFMISAGVFGTLLGSPASPAYALISSATARTVLVGIAMGATAVLLIHSPWGKRSGAHMNPAVTLTFLRLGKVHPWDALFYVIAQTAGGTLGVLAVAGVLGTLFTGPPVSYVTTVPGPQGVAVAFVAEALISFGLMATVLGLAAGCLVALYISLESPLSGMSADLLDLHDAIAVRDHDGHALLISGLSLEE